MPTGTAPLAKSEELKNGRKKFLAKGGCRKPTRWTHSSARLGIICVTQTRITKMFLLRGAFAPLASR